MSYIPKTCIKCNANLDPEEKCNCDEPSVFRDIDQANIACEYKNVLRNSLTEAFATIVSDGFIHNVESRIRTLLTVLESDICDNTAALEVQAFCRYVSGFAR